MASYLRATMSASQSGQILLYCQAVDFSSQLLHRKADLDAYDRMLAVPSLATTGRLPGWALLHIQLRVRLTTQVLPPWAVQDSTGTVMEIDLSSQDKRRLVVCSGGPHPAAKMCLHELPLGVYVKLDKCTQEFLPPVVCQEHRQSGFCKECQACRAFEGWV